MQELVDAGYLKEKPSTANYTVSIDPATHKVSGTC